MITEYAVTIGYISVALVLLSITIALVVFSHSAIAQYKKWIIRGSFLGVILAVIYFCLLVTTVIPSGLYSVPVTAEIYDDNTGEKKSSYAMASIDIFQQGFKILSLSFHNDEDPLLIENTVDGLPSEETEHLVYSHDGIDITITLPALTSDSLGVSALDAISADKPGVFCATASLCLCCFALYKCLAQKA